MVKRARPDRFAVGVPARYEYTVYNIGTGPTTGRISVSDQFAEGISFDRLDATGEWACQGAGYVECSSQVPIMPGDSRQVTVVVRVGAEAYSTASSAAAVWTPGDTNPGNDVSVGVTTPVDGPDLVLAVPSATFTVGREGVYAIKVKNNGPGQTLASTRVDVSLPSGLRFLGIANPALNGWACQGGGRSATCTNGFRPMAGGSFYDLLIRVAVDVEAGRASPVTTTVTVSTTGDSNRDNDQAVVETRVEGADLAARLVGGQLENRVLGTYKVSVINFGREPATGPLTGTATLPAGVRIMNAFGKDWTCNDPPPDPANATTVTCTYRAGAGADEQTLQFDEQAPDLTVSVLPRGLCPGNIRDVDVAGAMAAVGEPSNGDVNLGNNRETGPTRVRCITNLALAARAPSGLRAGEGGIVTVTVRNDGDLFAEPTPISELFIVVTDLPAGTRLRGNDSPETWHCSDATFAGGQSRVICAYKRSDVLAVGTSFADLRLQVAPAVDPSCARPDVRSFSVRISATVSDAGNQDGEMTRLDNTGFAEGPGGLDGSGGITVACPGR